MFLVFNNKQYRLSKSTHSLFLALPITKTGTVTMELHSKHLTSQHAQPKLEYYNKIFKRV